MERTIIYILHVRQNKAVMAPLICSVAVSSYLLFLSVRPFWLRVTDLSVKLIGFLTVYLIQFDPGLCSVLLIIYIILLFYADSVTFV
jgi:hypothetical protein